MPDVDCDAVIVGSGPAGATAADVLTEAGWSVIVLERGSNHLLSLEPPFEGLGRITQDEIKFQRRHFLGADPLTDPRTFRRSDAEGERIHVGEVNSLPQTVGGGGFHADGKLPRFREVDFRVASELGPVDGASLADWPLDYDALEPYYAEAERVVGVAGEETNPYAAWRSGPFPMPPGADMYSAMLLADAATRLGYHPYRAPTGANSVEYDGRPACNNCGWCAYYGCPIEAKGDPLAMLRRALRTGRVELRPHAYVTEVVVDPRTRLARGVRYLDVEHGTEHEVGARHVVLGAGAIETARLLLRSPSPDARADTEHAGVGNSSGLVGRNLMFHFQTYVLGIFDHRLHAHRGRAVTHLLDDPIVPDAEAHAAARAAGLPWFRGGIVEHGGAAHPIMESLHIPPGAMHTRLMLDSPMRDCMAAFTMQGEDLPQRTNRVDLDPGVRDACGFPVARVTYSPHRHEIECARHWAPRLEAVMREAGALRTFWVTSPPVADLPGEGQAPPPTSRHVMGTCRMGDDPATSVTDAWSRLHDVPNVVVCDASVFPTSAGYGPTLTLVALALRAARGLAGLPPLRSSRRPAATTS